MRLLQPAVTVCVSVSLAGDVVAAAKSACVTLAAYAEAD